MKSKLFTRRVNVARLGPVVDPFGRGVPSGPAGDPAACPACGGERLWFVDPGGVAEPVCVACVPYRPTDDLPEADGPSGGTR